MFLIIGKTGQNIQGSEIFLHSGYLIIPPVFIIIREKDLLRAGGLAFLREFKNTYELGGRYI